MTQTKLFSDLYLVKFLDISAKLFFSCLSKFDRYFCRHKYTKSQKCL